MEVESLYRVEIEDIAETHDCVWYTVKAIQLKTGIQNTVHRRFNDFFSLDVSIREMFKNDHIRSMLPANLKRSFFSSTIKRFDPEFIEERFRKLKHYIKVLVEIPRLFERAECHDLIKNFLGFSGSESIRETSVLFGIDAPLGLTAQPCEGGSGVSISQLKEDGIAQKSKRIGVHDRISRINGKPVLSKTYDEVIKAIKTSKRPMVIHFLGYSLEPRATDLEME
eukprot:TRINITY_DN3198_c0_g1_i1.p1 TRINITY_DN3198_c0_g1~~TRINITY_DN3198_c0_g1_i1.p1  ORF type:complete len:224 (-),score=56.47 TRINITY_DN3198_c0_g1_i1:221-892(-)